MALDLFAAARLRSIDHSPLAGLHRSFFQKQKDIVLVYLLLLCITEPRPLQLGKSAGHAWGQYNACNEVIG